LAAKTIQERKLFKVGNYMMKYLIFESQKFYFFNVPYFCQIHSQTPGHGSQEFYIRKNIPGREKNLNVCVLHNQLKIILFFQYIEHAHHQSLIAKLLVVLIQITRNA
jgi:hypothetical protein